jgi:hypothetical protein
MDTLWPDRDIEEAEEAKEEKVRAGYRGRGRR